jgi:uncharacterized membrane protein
MERRDSLEISRVKAYSDGVFAIAATLLAFNVKAPAEAGLSFGEMLGQLWPQITAFLISFIVAGIYWRNHNRLFNLLVQVNGRLNQLNMALLAAVCLMPFATGLIGNFRPGSGALALYASTIALIGAISAAQWAYTALHPDLLAAHASPREMWAWFAVACVAPAIFLSSVVIAAWSVPWAMLSWTLMLVFLPLARRLTHR